MTITLTKRHLFTLLFIVLFLGFGFSWYAFPSFYWLLAPAMGLTVISAIVLWFSNREDDEVKQRKALEKEDKQTVKRLFNLLLRELKDRGQFKQKYRLPWYLFISHNMQADNAVLSQMGFRHSSVININSELAIQIWLKNNAVMLAVNLSGEDYRALNCIKLFITRVRKFRSRQALNGILLSHSIDHLISKDKTSNKQMANDTRVIIDEAQQLCGQQLPLYVLFNQMANLADFCQFFASLEEHQLNGCFGALNNPSAISFTSSWFNKAFDNICSQMGKAVAFALDHQLNESFRRSVIAAPIQFRQTKDDISHYMTELLVAKHSSKAYQFRGMFFTNTESNAAVIDPLTKQVAYQLNHNEMVVSDGVKLPHSIFITELFNRFIRPEAGTAQINKLRKRILFSLQLTYWLLALVIVGSTAAILKVNFDYYQSLNASTLAKLDRYKRIVQKTPYHQDNLAQNVNVLSKLRDIYQYYKKPTPNYIFDFVPNPSLLPALEKTYHVELANVLLPALTNDLEAKLLAYQQSGNILQTAKLLTLIKSLQQHSNDDWLALESYYQGENVPELVNSKLFVLMADLLQFGIPKIKVNKAQIAKAQASLNAINNADVIFDYIKGLPEFSSEVDINGELGSNFEQLFIIQNPTILSVPFIYTPQGFAALNLNANSVLIKKTIAANKALLGEEISEFQISSLVTQLQRLYQREYISYWRAFIGNLSLKPVSSASIDYFINLLVIKNNSPLSQLFDVISYYTSPKLQSIASEDSKESDTDKTVAALSKKSVKPISPSDEQRLMEKSIKDEFSRYHAFVKADENGASKLSRVVSRFTKVKTWLNNTAKANDLNAEYFRQLTSGDKDQSLYQLSQIDIGIEQINDYRNTFIRLINESSRQAVTTYLDKQWQQQVSRPFVSLFSKKFPFDLTSDSNVSLKEFNRYFKLEGIFTKYTSQLFAKFQLREGKVFLNGFLPNEPIYVSADALIQLDSLKEIQQVLYQQGSNTFSIPFKLNVKSMSANLLKFEFFSQRTLMSYQHGPKLWRDFVWPDLTAQNELLAIFTDIQGQKHTINYSGDWGWLRLIYQNYQMNISQTEIKLSTNDEEIRLIVAVESDENPLEPSFFSQFKPPEQLIEAD